MDLFLKERPQTVLSILRTPECEFLYRTVFCCELRGSDCKFLFFLFWQKTNENLHVRSQNDRIISQTVFLDDWPSSTRRSIVHKPTFVIIVSHFIVFQSCLRTSWSGLEFPVGKISLAIQVQHIRWLSILMEDKLTRKNWSTLCFINDWWRWISQHTSPTERRQQGHEHTRSKPLHHSPTLSIRPRMAVHVRERQAAKSVQEINIPSPSINILAQVCVGGWGKTLSTRKPRQYKLSSEEKPSGKNPPRGAILCAMDGCREFLVPRTRNACRRFQRTPWVCTAKRLILSHVHLVLAARHELPTHDSSYSMEAACLTSPAPLCPWRV